VSLSRVVQSADVGWRIWDLGSSWEGEGYLYDNENEGVRIMMIVDLVK
jgi:hypothetical protein